jgi:hypothetical protein
VPAFLLSIYALVFQRFSQIVGAILMDRLKQIM